MADVTLIDPLGRTIVLHDHTWFGHIIKGHPEMTSRRAFAEQAITSPIQICYSKSDVDCRIYYVSDSAIPSVYVAVVADVVAGFVKTAYLATHMKGTIEW